MYPESVSRLVGHAAGETGQQIYQIEPADWADSQPELLVQLT